ncbi:chromosome partitioning protein [Actinoplanes sp. NPDC049681]|uniref:chromosome partitioning protein n=1 Tax=Actinoplanes sp. NPDC049681 TaxID=3363905 RepID=UPI00379AE3C7
MPGTREDAGQPQSGDSPWAKPPQRPGAAESGSTRLRSGATPVSGAASLPGTAPTSGAGATFGVEVTSAPGPGRVAPLSSTSAVSGAPTYYATPPPRQSSESDTVPEANSQGLVYRPAAQTPGRHQAANPPTEPLDPQSVQLGPHSAAPPSAPHVTPPGPQGGAHYVPAPGPQTAPYPVTPPAPQPGAHPATLPGAHQAAPPGPQPGPHQATTPGPQPLPHQATPPGPQPGPHQAASPGQHALPHQARPVAPQPGPPPPWSANGQPTPPVPGPYPPAVVPPHQAQQPPGPHPPPADPYQQLPWVSDGTPTAEEFARRRLAKPAEPVATMGARAMLQKGTMGLVRLAPGKREQEYKQDVEMVRRNFGGLRQVTVVNPKGGAGKTVAVLLLAMTFGQKRGGYVLAWDNNETQGTLGMRAQQDFHARTVRDMMRDLHLFRGSHGRVGDLSQYVRAQGEGMFDVLASDESATAGEMLTASAFAEIREIVSRFYKLIFVDTGNNVRAQNWQAAMDATDQLVITMSARNDSAETAARMLDHLEQSGRQRLVRQAVSVVTMPPTRKDIDLPAIQRHFAARTRAVLLAPYEKLIDSGEPLRYGQLSNGTRDSWLKIAAAVAEGL